MKIDNCLRKIEGKEDEIGILSGRPKCNWPKTPLKGVAMQKSPADVRIDKFFRALKRGETEEGACVDALATSSNNRFVYHTHVLTFSVLSALAQEKEEAAVRDVVEKLKSEGHPVTKAQLFEALFKACDSSIIVDVMKSQSARMNDDCIAAAIIAVMQSLGSPESNIWLADASPDTRVHREDLVCDLLEDLSFSNGHLGVYWPDRENLASRAIATATAIYVRDGSREVCWHDNRIAPRHECVPQPKERIDAITKLIASASRNLTQGRKPNGPGRVFYDSLLEQHLKRQPLAQRLELFAPREG